MVSRAGIRFKRRATLLICALVVLSAVRSNAVAQLSRDTTATSARHLVPMWSINSGYGFVTHEEAVADIGAECDVPFSAGYFCVGLRFVDGPSDYSYGFDLLWKRQIAQVGSARFFASIGGEFLVWTSRANAGIPLSLHTSIPLSNSISLDQGIRYTPLLFLGGEPGRGLFSLFTGIHISSPHAE